MVERAEMRRQAYEPKPGQHDYRAMPSYQARHASGKDSAYGNLSKQWKPSAYLRAIYTACEDAGVDKWSPNQLRHNAATRLRATHGLDVVQIVLGHSSADVTEIYAAADLAKAAAAIEATG